MKLCSHKPPSHWTITFDKHPAFVALAGDVGGTGFVLGAKRVEVLLQPLFARLPGLDGTARPGHADRFAVRPKKRGPDQAVPVIRFAAEDNEA